VSRASQQTRLAVAAGFNVAIVVAQVVAGVVAHSLGLLADAAHNLTDAAAVVLALVALRLARRAPSATRTFGGHRWPVLAAQANAASVLVVSLFVAVEAVRRLVTPAPVSGGPVVVVALIAAVGNLVGALVLADAHHHDLNTRAVLLHLVSDAAVSIAVAVAGAVILVTGEWWRLDPAVSLVICVVITVQAFGLLREASEVLLESTPAGLDLEDMRRAMTDVDGVTDVHDLHAWSLSDRMHAASAHVELDGHPTLEEANVVGLAVKRMLADRFAIAHATLELECEACAEPGAECEVAEPAPAVTERRQRLQG
jgi:cobalt-zinc-cadmium efflux system protein